RPWRSDRSTRIASSSPRMRRARSSTTRPNSVGVAPRRPRTRTGTPSSRSSWRICSDTLDCTVWSTSAAAENEPASVIASRASRCRISKMIRPFRKNYRTSRLHTSRISSFFDWLGVIGFGQRRTGRGSGPPHLPPTLPPPFESGTNTAGDDHDHVGDRTGVGRYDLDGGRGLLRPHRSLLRSAGRAARGEGGPGGQGPLDLPHLPGDDRLSQVVPGQPRV